MIHGLQAYRGIAALIVVLFHANVTAGVYFQQTPTSRVWEFGHAGVQFFFVLSGFIFLWVHAKDIGRPRQLLPYFQRRIERVYPVYWIVTLILLPFFLLVPGFGQPYHKQFMPLVYSLLLIPQDHPPHLGVGWTLVHEVFFYLAFASLLVNRWLGTLLLSAWGGLIMGTLMLREEVPFPWSFYLSPNNLLFLAGVLAAVLVRRWEMLRGETGFRLFALGNALFLLAASQEHRYLHHEHWLPVLSYGTAAFLIVVGANSERCQRWFRPQVLLLFLGDASYSIYLTHFPVLTLSGKLLKRSGWVATIPAELLFLAISLAGVIAGCCFYLCVERPLLRLLARQRKSASPRL
jgi:exopolysaccharide production protein ExoZ